MREPQIESSIETSTSVVRACRVAARPVAFLDLIFLRLFLLEIAFCQTYIRFEYWIAATKRVLLSVIEFEQASAEFECSEKRKKW